MNLSEYQHGFCAALWSDAAVGPLAELSAQAGFAVYRNTVIKACIDALQANYPAVTALVGETWFRAAAADYVRAEPPIRPTLLDYGEKFAAFLARFAPAAELTYLPAVAQLDRYWTEAHMAADAACADAAFIAACAPHELARYIAMPHPAARWVWFEHAPAFTFWAVNRGYVAMPAGGLGAVPWTGEGALLTRPGDAVHAVRVPAAACVLLDACAAGLRLPEAATAALTAVPGTDLSSLIAHLLQAGALATPVIHTETQENL